MDVSEEYKFLFHYTTLEGLTGILGSQSLWATHYKHFNDSQEVTHARSLLRGLLLPEVEKITEEIIEGNPTDAELQAMMKLFKGKEGFSERNTNKFIDILYTALLEKVDGPFILSFCGVSDREDDKFVKSNGLLSQWRGYGRDGGYVVEFDTKKLEQYLSQEIDHYYYPIVLFLDVGYGVDQSAFPDDFQRHLNDLKNLLPTYIRSMSDSAKAEELLGQTLKPFVNSIFRNKHIGFSEENEVRAVFCPGTEQMKHQDDERVNRSKQIKPIEYRQRKGTLIPFINLFGGTKDRLPITRIIVGPHRDKKLRAEALRMKLRDMRFEGIEVTCSEIPFLG